MNLSKKGGTEIIKHAKNHNVKHFFQVVYLKIYFKGFLKILEIFINHTSSFPKCQ